MVPPRGSWVRFGVILTLVPLLLSACGGVSSSGTNQIKPGGTVVDAIQQYPDSLLPMLSSNQSAISIDQALWLPLWYGDPTSGLYPTMVTEVPTTENGGISADLKTFTLHLRPGLKWSDGTPLTAEDCAYSFNLYANPQFNNALGFPTTDPTDPIGFSGATALDQFTLKIVLKHVDITFVPSLADGASSCLQKAHYSTISPEAFRSSPDNDLPTVTSGPFKVKERVKGDHVTIERNPQYGGSLDGYRIPYLDKAIFTVISDQNTILSALKAGQIDAAGHLDYTHFDDYRQIPGFTTAAANPAAYEVIAFNLQNAILSDVRVRKALTMSLNRQDIIKQVYSGQATETCDGYVGTWAHQPNLTCYPFDVAKANSLLDQAGWTDRSTSGCTLGASGCYRMKGGKLLELRYTTTGTPTRKLTQAIAQQEWAQVGIKIDSVNLSAGQLFNTSTGALCTGNFDLSEFANSGDVNYDPDDHSFLASDQTCAKGGFNYMHYSNSSVDADETAQQQTTDQSKRTALFHDITAQVLEDVPVFYLFTTASLACHRNRLHNFNPSGFGAMETWNIPCWSLDAGGSASLPASSALARMQTGWAAPALAPGIPATGCYGY